MTENGASYSFLEDRRRAGIHPLEPMPTGIANGSCGARLWENAWDEAADALCFPARQLGCRIDRLTRAA